MAVLEQFEDYEIEGLPRTEANLKWLWEHFDCTRCNQCCRIHTQGVRVTLEEAGALARRAGIETAEVLRETDMAVDYHLMPQPCRFLEESGCSVHDIKPFVCREYPLHFRKTRGEEISWVIITACPGGKNLLDLLLSGRQEGLEYRQV
jgi:Fe-S-cluster containining protein